MLVIKTDVTYTVTHQTTQILPPAGPPKRSRRERHEAVRTAARTLPIMTSGEGVLRWVTPRGPAASVATFGCGRARTSAVQSPLDRTGGGLCYIKLRLGRQCTPPTARARNANGRNTLARLPSPLPHTATIRTPLPISRTRKGIHPTLPNTTTHRKAMSLTPGLDGARRRRVGRAGCYVL